MAHPLNEEDLGFVFGVFGVTPKYGVVYLELTYLEESESQLNSEFMPLVTF